MAETDVAGSFIVGVLGRRGSGKTFVMNSIFGGASVLTSTPSTTSTTTTTPLTTSTTTTTTSSTTTAITTAATVAGVVDGESTTTLFKSGERTVGIDMCVTKEGVVLLDVQGISVPRKGSAASTTTTAATAAANPVASAGSVAAAVAEQVTLFLYSVCHVILVVTECVDKSSGHEGTGGGGGGSVYYDDDLWAFLKRMEVVKYRADGGVQDLVTVDSSPGNRSFVAMGATAGVSSGRRRDRRRAENGKMKNDGGERKGDDVNIIKDQSGDVDGGGGDYEDEEELGGGGGGGGSGGGGRDGDKTKVCNGSTPSLSSSSLPAFIFIYNRCSPDAFAPETHARLRDAITKAFKGSRIRGVGSGSSGGGGAGAGFTRMGSRFVRYEKIHGVTVVVEVVEVVVVVWVMEMNLICGCCLHLNLRGKLLVQKERVEELVVVWVLLLKIGIQKVDMETQEAVEM